jgi:hypothetical protein
MAMLENETQYIKRDQNSYRKASSIMGNASSKLRVKRLMPLYLLSFHRPIEQNLCHSHSLHNRVHLMSPPASLGLLGVIHYPVLDLIIQPTALRVCQCNNEALVHRFEEPACTGQCTPSTSSCDKCVHMSIGLPPYLRARASKVGVKVCSVLIIFTSK